jgi:tetratricopeptide (TPR) repeat protein
MAYAQMAINYITLKDFSKSEEYFRRAIELDQTNVSLWVNLANVLSEQDNREKKEEALTIYRTYSINTPEIFNIDSLIDALERELGEK